MHQHQDRRRSIERSIVKKGVRRGNHKSGVHPWRASASPRFRDSPGSPVVADDRGSLFCEQPRKQTVTTADVQDAFPVYIAQRLFNGGKVQPSAKGIIFDVIRKFAIWSKSTMVRSSQESRRICQQMLYTGVTSC